MGNTQNLSGTEATQKIKELVEKAKICHFVTNLKTVPLSGRPMGTLEVDEQANLWFFSDKNSEKNDHINADGRVQLFYSNSGSSEYLSLYGKAEVLKDRAKIEELWTGFANIWFEGKDDPDLTIIKVTPEEGHYWDTKNNKIVQLLKFAIGAITGARMDDGLEGDLKPGQHGG